MIQTKITKDIYHGDGTTRRFEVTFDYNTKDNVKQIDLYTCTYTTEEGVTKYNNDVTKITSNYDFEVVNNVTYAVYPSDAAVSDGATPMATGTAIIIMRNTPNEQLSTGQYTSDKVEKQLDRITMVAQELQEQLNRAYQAPEYVDKVNKADFATVANDIDAVNTVAAITEDIDLVNANAENITTVAQNIEDVNATGQNIEDVNTVSTNISDVVNVSDNMTTIEEVSENMDDVIAAADAVELVLPHITEINNVSDNINDIVTVASINTDVTAVASNETNISSVAGNETNINTVATNISNVNTAASNMAAIIAAPDAATNAANSALNAATSATNAQKWAEGTDSEVQPLGGTHSSKGWANRAQELVESIGTVMRYKGSVANYAALQAIQNPTLGDTYNVLDTGANYTWDNTSWDEIGSAVDLSAYRTSADQDLIDAGKQATLVSGTNIKTVNNTSLLGSGDVSITASAAWGSITGDLEDQTDLQNELDSKAPAILLSHFWSDHIINEMSCLRGDTFSWQSGDVYTAAYNHLFNDVFFHADTLYCWKSASGPTFVLKETPEVGDPVYYVNDGTVEFAGTILGMMGGIIYPSDGHSYLRDSTGDINNQNVPVAPKTETIGSYTITYYEAADTHKICLPDQETTIYNLFNTTGNARYFILDTANTRFKLPRWKHNKYQAKAPVIGNGNIIGLTDGTGNNGIAVYNSEGIHFGRNLNLNATNPIAVGAAAGSAGATEPDKIPVGTGLGLSTDPTKSGIEATLDADDMYLYFYVGTFTKTAYQETAGLNSELFNSKADRNLSNVSNTSGFRRLIEISNPNILPSWYKVFAEYDPSTGTFLGNWCEQGGLIALTTGSVTLNFLKPYKDTNYNLMTTNYGSGYSLILSKSDSSASLKSSNNVNADWKAEGYI